MYKKTEVSNVSGTSLQGYVTTTYDRLVEVFGEPHFEGDGYKVDAEWVLETPVGTATIYNYKDGPNYLGTEGTPVRQITDWHVGGRTDEVVALIVNAVTSEDEREKLVAQIYELLEKSNVDGVNSAGKLYEAMDYFCDSTTRLEGYKHAIRLALDEEWNHHKETVETAHLIKLANLLK
jgi:hypothetical protein